VRQAKAGQKPTTAPTGTQKSPATRDLEARLARKLGTKCEVKDRDGKGEIAIKYSSLDELDRILDAIF
jgi:ParB family chromosome partitioning protein